MEQLSPKAKILFCIQNISASVFVILVMIAVISIFFTTIKLKAIHILLIVLAFLFILFLLIILSYVWASLIYKYFCYKIDDKGIEIEKGIIAKKYINIPYNKIQNVEIYRNLLERILGLSHLNIQTAGYGAIGGYGRAGSEGILPGLDQATALKIKEELMLKIKNNE